MLSPVATILNLVVDKVNPFVVKFLIILEGPMKRYQTGLRLDEVTHDKLVYLADKDNRPLNNLVTLILKQYLAEYEKDHGEIKVDSSRSK